LARSIHLDTNIILNVIKSFTEHIKAPKKGWISYVPPPKSVKKVDAIIETPLELTQERSSFVEPIPYTRTMQKHILAQKHANQLVAEQKALRAKQEAKKD
jgi:hypothetical protein